MVQLTIQISLPIRVVCVQCNQDLKLEGQGPQPAISVVKCPGCGVRIRLIQGPPPSTPQTLDARVPKFRPPPKT